MPYADFQKDKFYLVNKFREPDFDLSTGIDNQTIMENLPGVAEKYAGESVPVIKARCFEYVCRNMLIDVNPHDWFPGFGCYNRNKRPLGVILARFTEELNKKYPSGHSEAIAQGNMAGVFTIWRDFDHSVPEWDNIMALGFPGLLERVREFREKHRQSGTLTPDTAGYFDGMEITLQAVLECLGRLIDYARSRHAGDPRIEKEIRCLENLRQGPPRDFYEVLQIIYIFFFFAEHIDHMQVRSLGNLDDMLLPYYRQALESGLYTDAQMREFMACFLMQWGSIDNYWGHPFYLGGTAADGSTLYNACSDLILDVFEQLDIPTPKIQLKIAAHTPDWLWKKALSMVINHNSSLVFVSDENAQHQLIHYGCTPEEARRFNVTGCYEIAARNSNGTGAGHVNMLKCIELLFNNGLSKYGEFRSECGAPRLEDIKSFDEFYDACKKYLKEIIELVIRYAHENEKHLHLINPGQLYSSTVDNSLKLGRDAFSNGTVYKNSGILLCGIGTFVDAVMAVKKAVFDEKLLSLEEFRNILDADWKGHEKLRIKMLRDKNKYGNGLPEVDRFAADISHFAGELINHTPNSRGGFFRASGHCAKQFIIQGKLTGATPDGRKAGEEFSKNLSPTMGADTCGVTALINSICTMDHLDLPGDFPLDVMMHPATVRGADGLQALKSLIQAYFKKGGMQIHFNIFNADTLKAARKEPEKYGNLQIRVCGWNVHFVKLPDSEQTAYICRAENIAE